MLRRIISVLMAVMLILGTMVVPAFADSIEGTSLKDQIPEAVVLVQVNNAECKMIEKMTDLTVTIGLKDGRKVAEVPVEAAQAQDGNTVALWLGYSFDEIDAQIKSDLAEFQKDFHLGSWEELIGSLLTEDDVISNMEKKFKEICDNYVIDIAGIPEDTDHKFTIETDTFLITSTLVTEALQIVKGLIGELLELSEAELDSIDSVQDMIAVVENFMIKEEVLKPGQTIFDLLSELTEGAFTQEDIAEVQALIVEVDNLLAYLKSEEYTGTVFAGVYMDCDCPVTVTYEIYHQYFKEVDGKMVLAGTENYGSEDWMANLPNLTWDEFFDYEYERYYYNGLSGDVIKAADYIQQEFNGETYEYVGSYDDFTIIYPEADDPFYMTDFYEFDTLDELYACEDWWEEYKFDEFVLGDESWDAPTGLVLRYELQEDETLVDVSDEETTVDSPEEDNTVQTGDDSNMTPFYIIMMLALAVMAAAVAARRKQMD